MEFHSSISNNNISSNNSRRAIIVGILGRKVREEVLLNLNNAKQIT